MKKLIVCIIALVALFSCSRDNNEENIYGYNAEEKEVLNILQGKWQQEGGISNEILSFAPFEQKKTINSSIGGIMYFYGNVTRQFYYVNNQLEVWEMYFYIDTQKREIFLYGVDNDKYSITQTKVYDYKIINNNTIELHDHSLSTLNTYNYTRIR